MTVSYKKLWKICIDKDVTKTQLRELAHLSPATVAKLSKGELVTMESLLKIASALECSASDLFESTPDKGSAVRINESV